ncbi:MAG TPA: hypothetical protein VFD01_01945 [Candidatus Dormibacteraeota bacterium]|jgi:hypothetical protein|nr:hypothetical protein [Candidatus Dormibacteraeota bacterium]
MHDATSLEASGLPTAAIVTAEFLQEARLQLEALGMPGLRPVVIAHPLSTLTDEQIAQRAAEAAPQVRRVWLGQEPGVAPAGVAGRGSARESGR